MSPEPPQSLPRTSPEPPEPPTDKLATEIINLIFNGFTDALKKGDRIEIRGFGTFSVRQYESYKGRNPKTGKFVDVRPKKPPFFKVGKELKEIVNGSKG